MLSPTKLKEEDVEYYETKKQRTLSLMKQKIEDVEFYKTKNGGH